MERQRPDTAGGYLVAAAPGFLRCIGVLDGEPDDGAVERFLTEVVRREPPGRDATLVCRTSPDPALARRALDRDVRVLDFADFQIGDGVLAFAAGQAAGISGDPAHPPGRYVPPRAGDTDLVTVLRRWVAGPGGRLATVTGAWGAGKTALLRELARRIHAGHDPVVPVLLNLPEHDWRAPLDELVAVQLVRGGMREVTPEHIRHLLREGRFVLLCDGLDDIGPRVPGRRLRAWQAMVHDRFGPAKMIMVGRESGLLDEVAAPYPADQVRRLRLDALDPEQILDFLTRRLGPDRARARRDLIGRVGGLAGMAGNPRMLALIAGIEDQPPDTAGLYRVLVDSWLAGELRRAGGTATLEELRRAVTTLARRRWESGETALPAGAFDVGTILVRDQRHLIHVADRSLLEWLVAGEIAARLEPGPPSDDLRALLRRPMSQLMVEFLCDRAGAGPARAWARAAPAELADAAHRILDHLG